MTLPADAIGKLREILANLSKTATYQQIVEPRDKVFARYQPVFKPDHIPVITEEEFRDFLLFENNRHWSGLHRQGSRICSDMPLLKKALSILVDENQLIVTRLDKVVEMVPGVGKAIATAILLIVNPEKYGVWNRVSETGLKQLSIWPSFDRGESFGNRYDKVNQIFIQLKDALEIDLWTLDALWWGLDEEKPLDSEAPEELAPKPDHARVENKNRFGMERHLHEFLRDNWNEISLGKEWSLYQEPGDQEAGYEYPCDVGRIDLLAKHRSEPRWLVIELKRNQTSDQTVGQVLRYMGWVKNKLAEAGETVEGLVICHQVDDSIRYALSAVPDVNLKLYEVSFNLKEPDSFL